MSFGELPRSETHGRAFVANATSLRSLLDSSDCDEVLDDIEDVSRSSASASAASAAAAAAAVASTDDHADAQPVAFPWLQAVPLVERRGGVDVPSALVEYVRGVGRCRSLTRPMMDADTPEPCPAFPTARDVIGMLEGDARPTAPADAMQRYQVSINPSTGQPVIIDGTNGDKRTTIYLARTAQGANVAIKATSLIETPALLRTSYATFASLVSENSTDLGQIRNIISDMARPCDDVTFHRKTMKDAETASLGLPRRDVGADAMGWNIDIGADGHETWFGDRFSRMALRMYMQLRGTRPATHHGTKQEWEQHVIHSFSEIRDALREILQINTDDKIDAASLSRLTRYDNDVNHEAINGIVAGAYCSLLNKSGAASAFAPLEDYWSVPTSGAVDESGPRLLMSVMPYYELGFSDVVFRLPHTIEGLRHLRSFFAQALAAIDVAQHLMSFVHNDAHTGNVRVARARTGMVEASASTWAYRIPGRHEIGPKTLYIPAADTNYHVIRFIDQDRAHCLNPCDMEDTKRAAQYPEFAPVGHVDSTMDSRLFVFDLVFLVMESWRKNIGEALAARHSRQELTKLQEMTAQFWDVVSAMAGTHTWTGWHRGVQTLHNSDCITLPISFYKLWCDFVESQTNYFTHSIRSAEVFRPRSDADPDICSPSAVLRMPFFEPYMQEPSAGTHVAYAADCTVDVGAMLSAVNPSSSPTRPADVAEESAGMAPPLGSSGVSPSTTA